MNISAQNVSIENREPCRRILSALKHYLPPVRVRHSLEVAKLAQQLCSLYNVEKAKGLVAGIGHDIAREQSDDELYRSLQRYGLEAGEWEAEHPAVLHGMVGSAILKNSFGITDKEILMAVEDHVLGRPGMPVLSQIIFAADFLEPARGFIPETKRLYLLSLPLDTMLVRVAEEIISFLRQEGKPIAPISMTMQEFFRKRAKEYRD